jgi:predicted MFS family arabinose efflux permease
MSVDVGSVWRQWASRGASVTKRTVESNSGPVAAIASLTPRLKLIMAVTCGAAIANVYYNQPLLAQIGQDFHASARQVGALPTLTQVGFAIGVFLIAPLGDVLERRRLILTTLLLLTLSLVAATLSPNLLCLSISNLLIGITAVISTLVLPFAVSLAKPEERGATVGSIAGAMMLGTLLSRTLSGVIGGELGWRFMYGFAAFLMLTMALSLRRVLPVSVPAAQLSYPALLRSMFTLVRTEPQLRLATANGMLLFGALSTFWATLIYLVESPAYHLGPAAAGLFGLVGGAGAGAAPFVGRLADRLSPRVIVGWATVTILVGFLILWAFGTNLFGLIVGVILIDVAAQTATVSNQATVYGLSTTAQSRMYTVYRAAYSLGGSLGAMLGIWGWSVWGWNGVCAVAVGLLVMALALHTWAERKRTLA